MQLRIVGLSCFLYNQGHILYTHTHTGKCNVNMYALFLNVYTEQQTVNCVRVFLKGLMCQRLIVKFNFMALILEL